MGRMKIENIFKLTQPLMKLYEATGTHFGFPECCITAFREGTQKLNKQLYKELMPKTGVKNMGFIPCVTHLIELASGTTNKETLLKNRICRMPFPYGNNCACPEKLKVKILNKKCNGTSQKHARNNTEPQST